MTDKRARRPLPPPLPPPGPPGCLMWGMQVAEVLALAVILYYLLRYLGWL